jgi:hypothetical protein
MCIISSLTLFLHSKNCKNVIYFLMCFDFYKIYKIVLTVIRLHQKCTHEKCVVLFENVSLK